MTEKRHICVLLLVTGCLVLAGCCYAPCSLLREDIRTVYVPVFDNQTWRRGLEVELTRAVAEELKLHTHLVMAPRDRADSTLEGELLEFEERGAVKDTNDQILAITVTARARFRWVDNLTGTDIVPWRTVSESGRHNVSLAEPMERAVFRELAQRIVEKLGEEW